jgi:hypothetical protein
MKTIAGGYIDGYRAPDFPDGAGHRRIDPLVLSGTTGLLQGEARHGT